MYKLTPQYQQISIFDFNQPGGLGSAIFCCPDVETINVFKIERIDHKEG